MSDWVKVLCKALNVHESGLSDAARLYPTMDTEHFEIRLGTLLRFHQARYLDHAFHRMGEPVLDGSVTKAVQEARARVDARLNRMMGVLHETLYAYFGNSRIDEAKATQAYGSILEALGGPTSLVVATTNYDLSGRIALDALGYSVDTGFRSKRAGDTPVLDPTGIVNWEEDHNGRVPYLHLHGAVGWYERGPEVVEHPADLSYLPDLGAPAVLYPDHEKDPLIDPRVHALWSEFSRAVIAASHVLVLGHSLHDSALVNWLKKCGERVMVVVYPEDGLLRNRVGHVLPDAHVVLGALTPALSLEAGEQVKLEAWVARSAS